MMKASIRLSPMAGITDWPFRLLCFEQGCDCAYTEMVSAMGYLSAPKQSSAYLYLLSRAPNEGPVFVQLFGKDENIMARAAHEINKNFYFDGIDINMGCPAKKIAGAGEGSALMLDMPRAANIIKTIKKNTHMMLSVKFRMGWDENNVNAIEFAKMAEDSGADSLSIHGRTRMQQYGGRANWDIIAKVKQSVSIPVFGNGDVFSGMDALNLLNHTQCDGLLVGRGALGNPWIFKEINAALSNLNYTPPDISSKIQMALRHAKLMIDWKGEAHALPEMRKHIAWYVNGMRGASKVRGLINTAKTFNELQEILFLWEAKAAET